MKAKLNEYELAVKEKYRRWQELKWEVKRQQELLQFAESVKRIEFKQVSVRMMKDLRLSEDAMASLRRKIDEAYTVVNEKKSLENADAAQVWYQIAQELKADLEGQRQEWQQLASQLELNEGGGIPMDERWTEYNSLVVEERKIRWDLQRLRRRSASAAAEYRKAVARSIANRERNALGLDADN